MPTIIGTPDLNLFAAKVGAETGGLTLKSSRLMLRLPSDRRACLGPYTGRRGKIGVSPEGLHIPRLAPLPVTDDN